MTGQLVFILVALIIIAFAIGVICYKPKTKPGVPIEIGEQMKLWAAQAVKFAAGQGVGLDYSPESIRFVEDLLSVLHESKSKSQLSDRSVSIHAHSFGAYVGEVIRHKFGGTWAEDSAVAGPKTFPLHWNNGESYPVGWCGKRIVNGPEDNVWTKFQVVTSEEYQKGGKTQTPTQTPDDQPSES